MITRYQFQIDGRGFGSPVRTTWVEAARDAVEEGYAVWVDGDSIKLDESAEIARLHDATA